MRRILLPFLLISMMVGGGCSQPVGNGLWNLKVGGKARLIAEPGETEVKLTDLATPAAGRRSSRKAPAQPKIETTTVAAGTTGVVLAVDGDDARFQIADGPHAGSIHWVECKRLEPIAD
ncbi:MAG: hypothetical protein P4L85_12095 [Paludisphaera borealis]|uniref:hypothetical protein n=1 Tax=Paludisphaera borealis TaxID=1387353 RepID=UPI002848D879|nr:hypothetical protein [Paludisphaera borealis]MDR3620084.1 hypothetical protein [Paludisphaera borealis]